jgi:tRNA A-37 threonylcarbamoyl transferase component Bud32
MVPHMHPMSGRVIAGRYRLDEPIGRGAMGVVWRAHDQFLDREVAVKEVVISEVLSEEERTNAYQRTLREARTAARLSHRGLVTVYDVAEEDGRPWIIMELVQARSLDQILASAGPLSPRRAGQMAQQLLAALATAHAAGVMHRDVKPSNVLLGSDGRAVLTDFGIATFQGDPKLTQTGMVMGSPGYTAPERIRGGPATPASDLWSLGATLYTAVEGRGPFEQRGGAITTMSAIIHEDAPASSGAGPLGNVIAALMRRDPGERPDALTASRQIAGLLPLLSADRGDTVLAGAAAEPASTAPAYAAARTGASLASAATSLDRAGTGTAEFPAGANQPDFRYFTPRDKPAPRAAAAVPPPPPPSPAPKRRSMVKRIALTVIAVVIVAAGGATAAELLRGPHRAHAGTATEQYNPPHPNGALAAVNQPVSTPPAGYTASDVPPSVSGTTEGFSIDAAPNWTFVHLPGALVWRIYSPDHRAYLHIELTPHTYTDMVTEATYIEKTAISKGGFPGYRRIALRPAKIRGFDGALWEFTWLGRDGMRMQGEDLLFISQTPSGPQSFALYLVAPQADWSQMLPTFEQELSTFNFIPAS